MGGGGGGGGGSMRVRRVAVGISPSRGRPPRRRRRLECRRRSFDIAHDDHCSERSAFGTTGASPAHPPPPLRTGECGRGNSHTRRDREDASQRESSYGRCFYDTRTVTGASTRWTLLSSIKISRAVEHSCLTSASVRYSHRFSLRHHRRTGRQARESQPHRVCARACAEDSTGASDARGRATARRRALARTSQSGRQALRCGSRSSGRARAHSLPPSASATGPLPRPPWQIRRSGLGDGVVAAVETNPDL